MPLETSNRGQETMRVILKFNRSWAVELGFPARTVIMQGHYQNYGKGGKKEANSLDLPLRHYDPCQWHTRRLRPPNAVSQRETARRAQFLWAQNSAMMWVRTERRITNISPLNMWPSTAFLTCHLLGKVLLPRQGQAEFRIPSVSQSCLNACEQVTQSGFEKHEMLFLVSVCHHAQWLRHHSGELCNTCSMGRPSGVCIVVHLVWEVFTLSSSQ